MKFKFKMFIPRSLCDNLHVYMCVELNYNIYLNKENEREKKETLHSMYKIVLIYESFFICLLIRYTHMFSKIQIKTKSSSRI